MGPRLAVSIMTATKELELIIAGETQEDGEKDGDRADVLMVDDTKSTKTGSWLVLNQDDWEMADSTS